MEWIKLTEETCANVPFDADAILFCRKIKNFYSYYIGHYNDFKEFECFLIESDSIYDPLNKLFISKAYAQDNIDNPDLENIRPVEHKDLLKFFTHYCVITTP